MSTAILTPHLVTGWRLIPEACLCRWDPKFGAGRGTWQRVTTDGRCPVHGKREKS